MIRFIDLRGQIYLDDDLPGPMQHPSFAFFDTVVDRFVTVNGCCEWSSLKDLEDDIRAEAAEPPEWYQRLTEKVPDWARF